MSDWKSDSLLNHKNMQKISLWNFAEISVNHGYNGIFLFFAIILWTNKVKNCQ